MLNPAEQFGTVDFVVFFASLIISLGIGIYFAYVDRNDGSTSSYMFGNRRMAAFPVSISMAVTFISALTVLAHPVEVYLYGAVMVWSVLGAILGVWAAAVYFVPFYCRLKIKTVYEVLELRFNRNLRIIIAAMANLQYIFYMGVASYIPALAISAITPLSLELSVITTVLICTVYTSLGGMKAVVWTDVVQGLIMLLGCISLIIKVSVHVGGIGNVWEASKRGGRTNFFQATLDPRVRANAPAFIIGYFLLAFQTSSISQPMVQRYLACGSQRRAQRACYLKLIPTSLFKIISFITGMCCYAYFEGCDPKLAGLVRKHDQTVPLLVVKVFKGVPGFAGLFVAAAYCGTLSTVSSGLNSLSTVFVNDFVRIWKPNLKEKTELYLSKIASFVIGLLVGVVAVLCIFMKGTVVRMAFATASANAGATLGMFLYMFFPMVSNKGATGSLILGLTFAWILTIGSLTTSPDPSITRKLELTTDQCHFNITSPEVSVVESTTEYMATTQIVESVTRARTVLQNTLFSLTPYVLTLATGTFTVVSGIIISLITGPQKTSEVNPELFIPLISSERFPKSVVSFFRFGVPELPKKIGTLENSEDYYELTKNFVNDEKSENNN